MNYRHIYHAGNFADCMKHALLLALIKALKRKPAGFVVLDTHAGCGRYDLSSEEAEKTGEWRAGIGQLLNSPPAAALADYLDAVRPNVQERHRYPGSPAFARAELRPQDQLIACELHPEDVRPLRRLFHADPQAAVHHRDGYEALRALLPPKDFKRGLVLVDPPFEKTDDFARCADAIALIRNRFRAGIVAVWYPIKHRTPVRAFHTALAESGVRDILALELWLREPTDPQRLNGCGLVVVNPPWKFEEEAEAILRALLDKLGDGEPGQGYAVTRIAEE